MRALHIAVGVLRNARGDVLISQRRADQVGAGEWELPGGKRDPGETLPAALARELDEELGVAVGAAESLIRIRHRYSDRQVLLDTWAVTQWSGNAHGREGQRIRWCPVDDLPAAGLLAADRPIVTAIRLPRRYAMTPPGASADTVLAWVDGWRRAGQRDADGGALLRLRLPELTDADYRALTVDALSGLSDSPVQIVVDRLLGWGEHATRLAVHAPEQHIAAMAGVSEWGAMRWRLASVHSTAQCAAAGDQGVDALVAGPVRATASHPGQAGRGLAWFRRLADGCGMPVFAIGGLGPTDHAAIADAGGQGVAAIRAYW